NQRTTQPPHHLKDRLAVPDDGDGPPCEIGERDPLAVDAEVMVDGRQEIVRPDPTLHYVLPLPVGRANHLAACEAAAGPQHGVGPRPVVATRLHRPGGRAGDSTAT